MSDIMLAVEQTRAEGLIGASEAAAVLGLDQYRSPMYMWRKLRGLPVNDERPAFVEEAATWGQLLEPVIRGKYALERGVMIFVPTESLTLDNWLRATPDGLVAAIAVERKAGTYEVDRAALFDLRCRRAIEGLLQIKTCSAYKRDEWIAGVPPAYEIQVRVEMAVTDLPWCDVSCLIGGQTRVTYRIERESKYEEPILRDLRAFHELVISGKEPSVDGSEAWREYASQRMRPSSVVLDADEETEALVANWLTAKRSKKELEKAEAEYKTKLLLRLSAAGATKLRSRHGVIPAYRVGGRTDWKGVAASLGCATAPDRFKKPSTTWTIKAPDDEGDD